MRNWLSNLPGAAKATVVFALLGFIISISSTSSSTTNGVVTSCSYFDLGALLFGLLALVTGAQAVRIAMTNRRYEQLKSTVIAIGAVGAAFGVLHVVRGFGVVGGPC